MAVCTGIAACGHREIAGSGSSHARRHSVCARCTVIGAVAFRIILFRRIYRIIFHTCVGNFGCQHIGNRIKLAAVNGIGRSLRNRARCDMFELAFVARTTEGYLVAGDNPATACKIAVLHAVDVGVAHARCICFRRAARTNRHRIAFGRSRTHTECSGSQTCRTCTRTECG